MTLRNTTLGFSLPRLFTLASALLLSACAVVPITPQTISGKYEIEGRPEGMWNGGEAIVLGDGTFEYSLFTVDLLENPHSSRSPIRGRYKLDGSTITFLNASVPYPQRTLTRRHKLFVLWTPKQIDDYHLTGHKPDDLLYQHP
ncbi:MAG: hypothetical protein WDN28_15330 [Chthoniobacter sp.]